MSAQCCDFRVKTSIYVEDDINALRGSVSANTFYGGLFSLSADGENGSGSTNTLSGQEVLTLSAVSGVSAHLNDNSFQLSLNADPDNFSFIGGQLQLTNNPNFVSLCVGGGYGDIVDGGLTINSCGNLSADGLVEACEYYKDGELILSPTLISCSNSTISADGWYRIVCTSGQTGRSDFKVIVYSKGGNTSPGVSEFRITKDWSTNATLSLTHNGGNTNNVACARLVDDGSQNILFDVNLATSDSYAAPETFYVDIIKERDVGADINYLDFLPVLGLSGSETEFTSINVTSTHQSIARSDCGALFDVTRHDINAYKPLHLSDGCLNDPSLAFSSDSNTGLRRISTDKFSIVNGASDTMTFNASNRVGIGTTTPSTLLDVCGDTRVCDLFTCGNIGICTTSPEADINFCGGTNGKGLAFGLGNFRYGSIWSNCSNAHLFISSGMKPGSGATPYYASNLCINKAAISLGAFGSGCDNIDFYIEGRGCKTADTEITTPIAMRLNSSGRLGINCTSPGQTLTVGGDICASGELFASNPGLNCVGDITCVGAGVGLQGGGTSGNVELCIASTCLNNWNSTYTTVNTLSSNWDQSGCINGSCGYISRFNDTDSIVNSELYQSGTNIGLGTTSPNSKLDIRGSVIINEDGGNNDFRVESDSSAPDGVADLSHTLFIDASVGRVGIGTPSPAFGLDVDGTAHISGSFSTGGGKHFLIDHPTKNGHYLKYSSLEGPENGVYVRGTTTSNVIELPYYWVELVDADSITVLLTPRFKNSSLFIDSIKDNKIFVGGVNKNTTYDYNVYATRKDLSPLDVEGVKNY